MDFAAGFDYLGEKIVVPFNSDVLIAIRKGREAADRFLQITCDGDRMIDDR